MKHFRDLALNYPVECGITLWAAIIGPVSLLSSPPSVTISRLPPIVGDVWSWYITFAAIAMVLGLYYRRISPVLSNAMHLMAAGLAVYGSTIIGFTSFWAGGATGTLALIIATVCVLRAINLRAKFRLLLADVEIENGRCR